jgi:hypothetical protein
MSVAQVSRAAATLCIRAESGDTQRLALVCNALGIYTGWAPKATAVSDMPAIHEAVEGDAARNQPATHPAHLPLPCTNEAWWAHVQDAWSLKERPITCCVDFEERLRILHPGTTGTAAGLHAVAALYPETSEYFYQSTLP